LTCCVGWPATDASGNPREYNGTIGGWEYCWRIVASHG